MGWHAKLKTARHLCNELGLEDKGKVQQYIDKRVVENLQPYVSFRTGSQEKSIKTGTVLGTGRVTINVPYAQFQAGGKVMIGAKSHRPWAREGEKLETKYPYVCHAELNAILNYRGSTKDLENAKIYVDLFPCNECAKIIIQSGIKHVIYLSDKYANSENNIASRKLFDECGVTYEKIKLKGERNIQIDLK